MKKFNLSLNLSVAVLLGLSTMTSASAQITSTSTSFLDNLSTTLIFTTLPKQNDGLVKVSNNEYEVDMTYKLNSRHSLNFYQVLGHRLEEQVDIDEVAQTETIQPTFYVADKSEFSHFYQITSPRIKNLTIKSKLTYAAPTTEDDIASNHGGYLQARLQVHFLLNNQTINLGLRPYFRKHIISNVIWTEKKPPMDMQIGNWFNAHFNFTSKIIWENMLNLRINFPVQYSTLSDADRKNLGIDADKQAVINTSSNYYSYLRYQFGENWNAFLHYRNESDFIDRNGYALQVTNGRTSVYGFGAEVSF